MTKPTPINVNLTLAVETDGTVSAIYTAADPLTALYLDADGNLDFRKGPNRDALVDEPEIHFSLLTTQLTIATGSRSKTLKTVKLHFDAKAEQTIDIIALKHSGKHSEPPVHRGGKHVKPGPKGKINIKPASFHGFQGTSTTLIFSDINKDEQPYEYTLYVAIDARGKSWLGLDPRIINQ